MRIVRLLRSEAVEFLVVGGQAEVIFGGARVTFDVDVCYRRTPENIARLVQAIRDLDVRLRGAPEGLPFRADALTLMAGCNFTFDTSEGKLDLLGYLEPVGDYESLIKNAETWRVAEVELKTIALEDLIRIKEHIRRDKDGESLIQLRAIREVRAKQAGGSGSQ